MLLTWHRAQLVELLGTNGVLLLPSHPNVAPRQALSRDCACPRCPCRLVAVSLLLFGYTHSLDAQTQRPSGPAAELCIHGHCQRAGAARHAGPAGPEPGRPTVGHSGACEPTYSFVIFCIACGGREVLLRKTHFACVNLSSHAHASQVVAGPHCDHLTIATALALERQLGGWQPPVPPKPV